MGLTCEQGRGARARRLQEARGLSRETKVRLAQMELSNIVVSAGPISLLFSLCGIWSVRDRGGDRELCSDLLQRSLGIGQSKLVPEEGGFGRITVRRGNVEGLRRVNKRLGPLHKVGDIEHCS